MRIHRIILLIALAHAAPSLADGPHIDLVLALDTSDSMDGLLTAARTKLWEAVNRLNKATPTPVLRVGLISYGNDGYDETAGWVRKDSDLTTDLDGVYAKLFALSTFGGHEYVARAVSEATTDMQWDPSAKTLRIFFVAGNEAANQDPKLVVEQVVEAAHKKRVVVNTIFCGSDKLPEATRWRDLAKLGGGRYEAIEQNRVITKATLFDSALGELSAQLNGTYVPYGAFGAARAAQQAAQDRNAGTMGAPTAAGRAVTKATRLYANPEWDLVDALANGYDLAAAPEADLPIALRAMTVAQRRAYLAVKAQQRATLQTRILALAAQRDQLLRAGEGSPRGLDDVLSDAIRASASPAGIRF